MSLPFREPGPFCFLGLPATDGCGIIGIRICDFQIVKSNYKLTKKKEIKTFDVSNLKYEIAKGWQIAEV